MSIYNVALFGEIDTKQTEEDYEANILIEGRKIELDINFDDGSTTVKKLKFIEQFIERIPELDKICLSAIKQDYTSGDTTKQYIDFHLEELPEKDVEKLLEKADKTFSKEEQLISTIHLVRVGFYPDNEPAEFATFDYSLSQELSNYLIVLQLSKKGKVNYITMES